MLAVRILAGRRERLVLLVCILSSSLVGLDGVMTPVALPAMAEDLNAGLAVQQWVVAAFLLAVGSLLLVGGALGDVYGRWLVFGAGAAGFAVASLLSALAPTVAVLLAGRFLQGAAAAVMVPAALAVITTTFHGAERSRAIGAWAAWSAVSVIVGPGIGGLLVTSLSWRAIYGALVPMCLIVVVLIVRAAPVGRERSSATLDRLGSVLAVPVVGAPVFVIIQGPELGWVHPALIGAGTLAVASWIGFVWRERRAHNPLAPFALFTNRTFTILNLVTFVLYAALISCGVYTVLFLQQTAGYAPAVAGLVAVVPVAVLFLFAKPAGAMAQRYGSRAFISVGALIVGVAVLLLLRTDSHADLVTVVLPSVVLHGVGLTMIVSPLTTAVMGAADEKRAGVASGVNNAAARIGSLFGVAVVGLVIAVQFSAAVEERIDEPGTSTTTRGALSEAALHPFSSETPPGVPADEQSLVRDLLGDASVAAFRAGVGLIGGLAIFAGLLAGVAGRRSGADVPPTHDAMHDRGPLLTDGR